jgi:hypothetical protein
MSGMQRMTRTRVVSVKAADRPPLQKPTSMKGALRDFGAERRALIQDHLNAIKGLAARNEEAWNAANKEKQELWKDGSQVISRIAKEEWFIFVYVMESLFDKAKGEITRDEVKSIVKDEVRD